MHTGCPCDLLPLGGMQAHRFVRQNHVWGGSSFVYSRRVSRRGAVSALPMCSVAGVSISQNNPKATLALFESRLTLQGGRSLAVLTSPQIKKGYEPLTGLAPVSVLDEVTVVTRTSAALCSLCRGFDSYRCHYHMDNRHCQSCIRYAIA